MIETLVMISGPSTSYPVHCFGLAQTIRAHFGNWIIELSNDNHDRFSELSIYPLQCPQMRLVLSMNAAKDPLLQASCLDPSVNISSMCPKYKVGVRYSLIHSKLLHLQVTWDQYCRWRESPLGHPYLQWLLFFHISHLHQSCQKSIYKQLTWHAAKWKHLINSVIKDDS